MPPPYHVSVPHTDGTPRAITIGAGEVMFVLGANGTGKSSLLHHIYTPHSLSAQRIAAHRQTWFASATVDLTASARKNTGQNISGYDVNPQSRYKDDYSAQRSMITIFDLIDAENVRAREIARAVDSQNIEAAQALSKHDAPIKIINELLRLSNIPIEVMLREHEQVLASKNGSPPYSIAELSDGERNALLIAANVLTAPTGTLLIVDEPERHLHRSIISPLLTTLFARRADCAFIVSTHDLLLPLDNPEARTALIRSCIYNGPRVQAWEIDFVPAEGTLDEGLKKDILGSRRRIVFVEGNEKSLDQPLYSLVFPAVSVVPKANCREVMHAVHGIRDSGSLHWLHAWGIIDRDQRSSEEVEELAAKGIRALPFYSVESIYYHPELVRRIAERQCVVSGADPTAIATTALDAALKSILPHRERLTAKVAERTIREKVFQSIPGPVEIGKRLPVNISIDIDGARTVEEALFDRMLEEADIAGLIARYPIRETPAITAIATRLDFTHRSKYEAAVRKLLMDDVDALKFVRLLFGGLHAEIEAV